MDIKFDSQQKEKLQKAITLFLARSNEEQLTTKGLNSKEIDSIINSFLIQYGYIAKCSFGAGNKAKNPYIVFIRKDTPHIKASCGVYARICFHTENNQVEVSINTSYKTIFHFQAEQKVKNYNLQQKPKSYFNYPDYDIDAIISKLEQDLQWFLQIPVSELKSY